MIKFTPDWIDEKQDSIKIFHSKNLDKIKFTQILKFFLMGQKIIFDLSLLTDELRSKLEVFLVENKLKIQQINFVSNISVCELGEGILILYDGSKFEKERRLHFWDKLFDILNITQIKLNSTESLVGIWRIRAAGDFDLNYIDIRRLNLYNPTSYKKSLIIPNQNGFAFLKIIDPSAATAKSGTNGIDVEILPNGKIGLDFLPLWGEKMSLYFIYHFKASQNINGEFLSARYRLLFAFNKLELIDRARLSKIAEGNTDWDSDYLTFLNLEDLTSFVVKVGLEFDFSEAYLVSSQDYNIGLEELRNKDDFWNVFESYGEKVVIAGKNNKKGFLGKIFT